MSNLKDLLPALSPQHMRILKKIFLDHQNDQGKILEELDSHNLIYQEVEDMKFDWESHSILKKQIAPLYKPTEIAFQACCSLFSDLLKAGWQIEIGVKGFQIATPSYDVKNTKETLNEIKSRMRKVQQVNRDNQLKEIESQRFIERMQRPRKVGNEKKSVLDLIDDGKELSEYFYDIQNLHDDKICSLLQKIIKPEVVICYPEDPYYQDEEHYCPYTGLKLKDIWRYFRLTWSSEHKSIPGKSLPILIRNAARPNKPIIGIAQLRSAALADNARDTMIGWVNEKTIRNLVFKKELDIKFVVKCLISSLNSEIEAIKFDDIEFLNNQNIKHPDQTTINKLLNLYEEEKIKRENELSDVNIKITRVNKGHLNNNWQSESELPVFRKKRAIKLARLLEVRSLFNEVDLVNQPARGYAQIIHHTKKNGSEMISRVLREIRNTALAENIMDVSVCGAIAPYNEILGGKLVASLMASQEMRELFRQRYHSKYKSAAIIASSNKGKPVYRDANLLCLTTTSLYGVASSQYNRIKFLKKNYPDLEQDIIWQEVYKGDRSMKTKGIGVYHISTRTIRLLSLLTFKMTGRFEVNSKFGEGTSPKLRKITFAINLLFNFSKLTSSVDDILSHSIQRKNYICFLIERPIETLLKRKKNYTGIKLSSVQSISNAWIKRWLLKRIKRKDTLDKLIELNSDKLKKSIYMPEILEFEKNKNQILMFPNV